MTIERTQVLWIGPRPRRSTYAEFERRHLGLTVPKGQLSDQDFALSRAVVFCFDSENKGNSIGLVKEYAAKAAEHGVLVILHATHEDEVRLLQSHIGEFPDVTARFVDFPRPIKQFSMGRPAYELAELAARHPAGPPLNLGLEIKGKPPEKESDRFLLKRHLATARR
jgi:hypothetical protein